MLKIPRRHSHYIYAVIQSGLTTAIAAAVASVPFLEGRSFLVHWLSSWMVAWVMMMPIVLLAAPVIRSLTYLLTHEKKLERPSFGSRGWSVTSQFSGPVACGLRVG